MVKAVLVILRALIEETGTTIEIEDDGTVKISRRPTVVCEIRYPSYRRDYREIEVGRIYNGKVTRIKLTLARLLPSVAVKKVWFTSQIADKRVESDRLSADAGQEVRPHKFWKLTAVAVYV